MICKAIRTMLLGSVVLAAGWLTQPLLAADTDAEINVTGIWTGVNYTSKVPGPHTVKLILKQDGSAVTGSYCVSTGVCGKGAGKISGNTMEILWKNITPSCPGEYKNHYVVSDDQMVWKFSGEDCLGAEDGHGYAKKES